MSRAGCRRLLRQFLDIFAGQQRQNPCLLAGPGRFDGSVERQQVGLPEISVIVSVTLLIWSAALPSSFTRSEALIDCLTAWLVISLALPELLEISLM